MQCFSNLATGRKRNEQKYISVKSMNWVIKKRLLERIHPIKTVETTVKTGNYAPLFLFLTLEIPVYEPRKRCSAMLTDVRQLFLGK